MKKGKIIVIEGACDGIGKTTQYELLKKRLEAEGNKIITHHFHSRNTPQGTLAENYLQGEYSKPRTLSPYFINCLYAVDRAVTWQTFLKKEYEDGKYLLLDRYNTSSIIYQGALVDDIEERKKFIDYIVDYEFNKLGIGKPDAVIFLYAPYDMIQKLLKKRNGNKKAAYDEDFMKRVYDNAMFVSKYLGWDIIDCSKDGEMLPIEEIHEMIYESIKNK